MSPAFSRPQSHTFAIGVLLCLVWSCGFEFGWAQPEPQPKIELAALFTSDFDPISFNATPQSRIWIKGSTNISNFQCSAHKLNGVGSISDESVQWNAALRKDREVGTRASATISVDVSSLDCGKERMNQDMYNALKADQYDSIQFKLLDTGSPEPIQSDSLTNAEKWYSLKVIGKLRIAGVEREVNIALHTELMDFDKLRFRLKGSHHLKMTSYNITPPTALYGLIEAQNELAVHFDLVVQPSPKQVREYNASGN